jgi:hypothetical protein
MIRILSLTGLAILVASPAFAAGVTCSTATSSKFQPKTTLERQLKAEGTKVKQIKTERGCYEVYGIDKDGKKVNVAFNAETLQKVDNPEAGEQ